MSHFGVGVSAKKCFLPEQTAVLLYDSGNLV